jgi:zinc D-Ala-D-Ala carboxypeptidase
MDGLAAIGSRIAEINAQLARLSAPAVTSTTPSAATSRTASSATTTTPSFDDVLAGAVRTSVLASSASRSVGGAAMSSLLAAQPPITLGSGTTSTGTTPAVTTTTATTHTASSGRLTSSGAPVELARYGNGKVPAAALESIGGGHRLWAPAAEAFQRLRAAAKRDGVHIGVTDSYRSYADQVDVARRKGLHSQGGLAARPGTSEHGWGKSLDLQLGATAQRWMRAHAGDYGFTENVSREPWHWTYAAS